MWVVTSVSKILMRASSASTTNPCPITAVLRGCLYIDVVNQIIER